MRHGKYGKIMNDWNFYKDKKVFVTGHTGFVGSWLCHVLLGLGAKVSGYALEPPTNPNLFTICDLDNRMDSFIGDIRDLGKLKDELRNGNPDMVFHLAAQPIVLESYVAPYNTYEVNVMGTINLLESIRTLDLPIKSVVNVTTDKVYYNHDSGSGFQEEDPLDGFDPYSNSKSCSELVTHCYKNSFFEPNGVAVSTARAGNIIGGGDFAPNRIMPDCIKAAQLGEPIVVRNPGSIRPYQHVLESVFAYLLIGQQQYQTPEVAGYYNIGPDEQDCKSTGEITTLFCNYWGGGQTWIDKSQGTSLHESSYLKLNCEKMKNTFGWHPRWDAKTAIEKTVDWTKTYASGGDITPTMNQQIAAFLKG